MRRRRVHDVAALLAALTVLTLGAPLSGCGGTKSLATFTSKGYGFSVRYDSDRVALKVIGGSSGPVKAGATLTLMFSYGHQSAVSPLAWHNEIMLEADLIEPPVTRAMVAPMSPSEGMAAVLNPAIEGWGYGLPRPTTLAGIPGFVAQGSSPFERGVAYTLYQGSIQYTIILVTDKKTWLTDGPVLVAIARSFRPTKEGPMVEAIVGSFRLTD